MGFDLLGGMVGRLRGVVRHGIARAWTPDRGSKKTVAFGGWAAEALDRRVLLSVALNTIDADVNEEGSRGFLAADFARGFADSTGGELQDIQVTSLPANGSLTASGTAVSVNQVIAASAVSTLVYAPTPGYSGPDSFQWNATDGTGYAPSSAAVDLTVSPLPHLSIAGSALVKGNTGTSNMIFAVTRSGDLNTAFTVNYGTVDGTAIAGIDYTPTSGTLGFASGQTTASIAVPVIGNTVNQSDLTFTVHLSDASVPVEFPEQAGSAVGSNPSSVVTADLRGDGKTDLVVANYNSNTVSVLLGNDDGTFQPAANYYSGALPSSLAVGDFNGDGKLDLAVTNQGGGNVSVLLGNGDGTFRPAVDYGAGLRAYSVVVGDFTGNGKLDLAVADETYDGTVSILLGNGDGTFQSASTCDVGILPYSITAGDFTNNGTLDLAVANYGNSTVSVLIGNGDGTFQTAVNYLAGAGPVSVIGGDFNGDDKLDLAVANFGSNNVSVLLGNGDGTFQSPVDYNVGSGPLSVTAGDFTSNGKLDLVTASTQDGTVSLLAGNGDGTFQAAANYSAGSQLSCVAAGDFNADGRLDMASTSQNPAGSVAVLLGSAPAVVMDTASAVGTIQSNQTSSQALSLTGPAYYLKLDPDSTDLDIWPNTTGAGAYTQQELSTISSVTVQGTTGRDSVVVDYSAGDPLPAGGLSDTGGGTGTSDTLTVIGSTGNDAVSASATGIVINGSSITAVNVGQLVFTPGAGTDSLSALAGTLLLAPPSGVTGITPMTFSSISISSGAKLAVVKPASPATRSVLVTSSLALAQSSTAWTATLDLSGNDLVVHNGVLSALTSQIASGYNPADGGNWLGTGITSSAAAGDSTHLTALGVIQNSIDGGASALYATGNSLGGFDGLSTVSTDLLVKYTYYGDTDLSGQVDGSDYSRIDNGFVQKLSGWINGDFNYDNAVDGSDYTLIDNAFNTQGASFAAD